MLTGLFLTALLTLAPLLSSDAFGEGYVGIYGGIANPGPLSNARVSSSTLGGGVNDARTLDLELEDSLVGGGKIGHFFANSPWIGLEADIYSLKPELKKQTTFGADSNSNRTFADTLNAVPLRVSTAVVNLIIRSPAINEKFQPYGGFGYGAFMATGAHSKTFISPGVNMVAGARYLLTEKLAAFGEFKFNRSALTFSGVEGRYSTQIFVFGLMWHFKDDPGDAGPNPAR
jgi:hypothetical protein